MCWWVQMKKFWKNNKILFTNRKSCAMIQTIKVIIIDFGVGTDAADRKEA
jgi:hypothetical protein